MPPLSTVYFRFDKELPDEAGKKVDAEESVASTAVASGAKPVKAKRAAHKKKEEAAATVEPPVEKPKRAPRSKKAEAAEDPSASSKPRKPSSKKLA